MSDILIKNMELPKGNDYLHLIIQGGKVHTAISCGHLTTDKLNVAKAIEVKPHGRCIDADALAEYYDNLEADNGVYTEQAGETADTIRNAPTVLEASNGTDS